MFLNWLERTFIVMSTRELPSEGSMKKRIEKFEMRVSRSSAISFPVSKSESTLSMWTEMSFTNLERNSSSDFPIAN